MNKVKFQGIIDLYAEDYQFIQDTIEESFVDLIQQLLAASTLPCVLRGFVLSINSTDNTTFDLIHTNGRGGVITGSKILITSDSDITSTSAGFSSATRGVYLHYIVEEQSYNRSTGELDTTARCFDYSTQTLVHNRSIDTFEIVTLSSTAYSALTSTEQLSYVFLGNITTDSEGVITSVDTSAVTRVSFNIPDGTIINSHLSPSIQIDPTYVDTSDTETRVNDSYSDTPSTLQDDLNKIRTILKQIKNTPTYDTYVSGIEGYIPELVNLYRPGILASSQDAYDNNFSYTIAADGSAITINTGVGLWSEAINKVANSATFTIATVAPPTLVTVGDWANLTGAEELTFGTAPDSQVLSHYPVQTSTLHILEPDYTAADELTRDTDFTLDSSTGTITSVDTGNLSNETVRVFYTYGRYRYDYIYLNSTGLHYGTGTPSDTTYPQLPYMSPDTGIILLYIYRHALGTTISEENIVVPSITVPAHRVINEIGVTLSNNVSYYEGTTFYAYRSWGINQIALVNSSTYVPLESGTDWSIGTVNGIANILTISNTTTILQTIINTQEDDEVWLSIILPTYISETTNNLILNVSYTADNTAFSSDTFTSADNVTILSNANLAANTPAITLLYKGFSKGLHKLRIKIADASVCTEAYIEKLVVGKLDLYYETRSRIINGDVVINGDLRVNGDTASTGTTSNTTTANKMTVNSEGNATTALGSGYYIEVSADADAGYLRADESDASTMQLKAPTGDGELTFDTETNATIATDAASGARSLYIDPGTSRINQDVRTTATPSFYGVNNIRSDSTNPYSLVGNSANNGGGMLYTQAAVDSEGIGRVLFYRRNSGTNSAVFSYSPSSSNVYFRGNIGIGIQDATEALHIVLATNPAIKLEKTGTNAGSGTIRFNSEDKSILFITE